MVPIKADCLAAQLNQLWSLFTHRGVSDLWQLFLSWRNSCRVQGKFILHSHFPGWVGHGFHYRYRNIDRKGKSLVWKPRWGRVTVGCLIRLLGVKSKKLLAYIPNECTCHADFQPAIGSCKEEGSNVVGVCVFKKLLSKFGFIPGREKKRSTCMYWWEAAEIERNEVPLLNHISSSFKLCITAVPRNCNKLWSISSKYLQPW